MNDLAGPPVSRARGFDAADLRFVQAKRDAGVSWSNIAKMIGRSETDVRAACDREGQPPVVAMAKPETAAPEPPAPDPKPVWRPTTQAERTLVYLEGQPSGTRRRDIALALDRTAATVGDTLKYLQDKGHADHDCGFWKLTARGLAELNRLSAP